MANSKLLKIVKTIGNIILVNFLWLLFSLPVITIGASTCAAFYLNFKLIENEDTPVWENFVKGFKSSFVQGTVMWIFTVLVSGCLFFIWRTVLESGFSMMSIGAVICTLVLVMFFVYTFPLIARYNNTFKNIFKNSAGMSFTYWVKTILYLISFATFVIPGLCIYIQSVITKGMFTQMELHQKNVEAEAETAESDSESE